MTSLHSYAWFLCSLSHASALFITVFYWSIIYDSSLYVGPISYGDVNAHVLNSVVCLVDIFVSARPVRLAHFYIPLLFFGLL